MDQLVWVDMVASLHSMDEMPVVIFSPEHLYLTIPILSMSLQNQLFIIPDQFGSYIAG